MYKSSSMTFIYKYVFTPLWGLGFLSGIISTWNNDDQFFYDWSRGAAIMVSWALIWLTILMIRLRNVETSQEYLIIHTIKGQKKIDYTNISWISQVALIHPAMISIKYYDNEISDYKKILVLPSMSSQLFKFNFLKEHEMTEYIREKIITKNPGYSKENEPSRWLPIVYIAITALPVNLIVELFFSTNMK